MDGTYKGYIIAEQHSTWKDIEFSFTVEFITIEAEVIPEEKELLEEEPVVEAESTANSTTSSTPTTGVSSTEEEDEQSVQPTA